LIINTLKNKFMINDILLSSNKAKGKRPYFLEDPALERVLNITMAVTQELAVVRERLDTLERILEKKGILSQAEIEAFEPDEEQAQARQHLHASYIARVLRIVQQELEALQEKPESNRDMVDIAQELGKI
jgi:predicted  nucleic acid-binding Zn-ribbon protein